MKEFLRSLETSGSLTTYKDEISPDFQISAVLTKFQEHAFLFERVSGSRLRVAGNLYGTRSKVEQGLGIPRGSLVERLEEAYKNPLASKGKVSAFDKSEWDYNGDADLSKIPILFHFDREAGHYITAGIVVAKLPDSGEENLSFHRMLVLGKNKAAVRIVPRHLSQIEKESNDGIVPVSVLLGPPPAVFVAATLQTEFGLSEYKIANNLASGKLELRLSESSDIALPADTEIVLEGQINFRELSDEGPFVDLTGTYDEIRKQPVITFSRMHVAKDAVYQTVVASTREHSLFMGLPQELKIRDVLSKSVPRFRGINLTPASGGYFHCIVSLDKANDGDGKTAILNCFAASHPLKLVIAVDSDVDPFDLEQVEWALSTRFQADLGIVKIKGARGSSLDPSSAKSAVTAKLGLDATLGVKQDRKKFERATIKRAAGTDSILSAVERQLT